MADSKPITPAMRLDAALIADCDEFARLLNAANAMPEDASPDETAEWDVLGKRIIAAPTHTADGVLARVRALAAAHGDFGADFNAPEDEPHQMLAAIMRAADLAGPGAPPRRRAHRDLRRVRSA